MCGVITCLLSKPMYLEQIGRDQTAGLRYGLLKWPMLAG